jgi:hypothetical protein
MLDPEHKMPKFRQGTWLIFFHLHSSVHNTKGVVVAVSHIMQELQDIILQSILQVLRVLTF